MTLLLLISDATVNKICDTVVAVVLILALFTGFWNLWGRGGGDDE